MLTAMRKQVKAAIKAFPGITVHFTEHDEIRVNIKGGKESSAYYTTDPVDAIGTARLMQMERDAKPIRYRDLPKLIGRVPKC